MLIFKQNFQATIFSSCHFHKIGVTLENVGLRLQSQEPTNFKAFENYHEKFLSNGLREFRNKQWLVVTALNLQSRGPEFKITWRLQGRPRLSSFRDRPNEYQKFLGTYW